MEAMTLERVRDWHRAQANNQARPFETTLYRSIHDSMADAIDAHLAQPAQADRGSVCEVIAELRLDAPKRPSAHYLADKLEAALTSAPDAAWDAIVQHCMVTEAVTPDEADPYGTIGRVIDWYQAAPEHAQAVDVELARKLIEIVRKQCGGYLSGPGHDALMAAKALDDALSGEKAGPAGDDADAQWALRFKAAVSAIESEEDQPMTAACGLLLIDACVERKAKTVTLNFDGVEHKDGRDLGDWTVTVECRRKAPLPASPTPDKEGA